jgi:hypothetical protein
MPLWVFIVIDESLAIKPDERYSYNSLTALFYTDKMQNRESILYILNLI